MRILSIEIKYALAHDEVAEPDACSRAKEALRGASGGPGDHEFPTHERYIAREALRSQRIMGEDVLTVRLIPTYRRCYRCGVLEVDATAGVESKCVGHTFETDLP